MVLKYCYHRLRLDFFYHHRLQDPNEKDFINCDPYLEQVFGCSRMRFAEVPSRLGPLQQPPDPIVINHMITVEGDAPKTAYYDIEVELVSVPFTLFL